jgi:hypothetical protein
VPTHDDGMMAGRSMVRLDRGAAVHNVSGLGTTYRISEFVADAIGQLGGLAYT